MNRSRIFPLLLITGLLWVGSGAALQAQETSDAKLLRVEPRGSLRYNSDGPGFDPYVHFEGFLPLFQTPGQSLTFLDGRLLLSTDNGTFSGNVVLAHRFFSGQNQIFGGYVAYDRRNTGDSNFDQIGFGLERLTSSLDLRLNAYIPVGETRSLVNTQLGNTVRIVGNTLGIDRRRDFEVALSGFDADIGTRLFALGEGHVWGYVGAYYYSGSDISSFAGARGRLVARPQRNVEVNLTVQSDREFGTRAWVGLGLTFPGLPSTRQADNSVNLAARIGQPVERQIAVVVTERTVNDTVAVLNPLTGQPFRVLQVNTGFGSSTDLSNLSFANGDLVLVGITDPSGAFAQFASSGNVSLADNVQLLATTTSQQINTSFGLVTLAALTPSTTSPTIRGTVTLANNNTVRGFNITPTNAPGIRGTAISTPTLQNNTITGATTGILLQTASSSLISNNTISNASLQGISITDSSNANMTSNIVSGSATGILLRNVATSAISNNTVNTSSAQGISITDSSNASVTGNSVSGSATGILLRNVATSAISNNTINTSSAQGISITDSSNASVTGNSVSGSATGILLQNTTNPVITNNTVTNSRGRGISLTESTNARITGNTISSAVGEGIGLDNALGTVLIDGNTVRNITQTSTDTNLEAGIFIRNNRGDATITISNNITEDNLQSGNRVDGIEVNLCRGNSFAVADRFTDNAFATCGAPASMTVSVSNNIVRRIGTGTDGSDGIDFNIGDGATLTATLDRNTIEDVSDAGFTLDIVSSANPISRPTATINLTNNTIRRILNDDGITVQSNSAGAVTLNITGNTIQDIRGGNDGIDLEFTTIATNPSRATVTIANNQITQVADRPIEIDTEGTALLQTTISNNILSTNATTTEGESIRVRSQNTSSLTATINNNSLTQATTTLRSLEVRADDPSRLCANVFQNTQVRGGGFRLRPDDVSVNFRIVDSTNLSTINNGVAINTLGSGTVLNITQPTFNLPTPGGCQIP